MRTQSPDFLVSRKSDASGERRGGDDGGGSLVFGIEDSYRALNTRGNAIGELLGTHYPLLATWYPLFSTRSLIPTTLYPLHGARFSVPDTPPLGARYSVPVEYHCTPSSTTERQCLSQTKICAQESWCIRAFIL